MPQEYILIVDFENPHSDLVARRIRDNNVYTETVSYKEALEYAKAKKPMGIILAGGQDSVCKASCMGIEEEIFELNIPVLGISYGAHLLAKTLGATVKKQKENINKQIYVVKTADVPATLVFDTSLCYLNHTDQIVKLPKDFVVSATSEDCKYAVIEQPQKRLYAVQFYPEAEQTSCGSQFFYNFAVKVCGCSQSWTSKSFIDMQIKSIKETSGDREIICALWGDMSSSVSAILASRAVGEKLTGIFIDNGFCYKSEQEAVVDKLEKDFGIRVVKVNASKLFMSRLAKANQPQDKKIIISEETARIIKEQGEIISKDYLKTEISTQIFEEELCKVGVELGLSKILAGSRHFSQYGFAIKVQGVLTASKIKTARDSDRILLEELAKFGLTGAIREFYTMVWDDVGTEKDGEENQTQTIIIKASSYKDRNSTQWAKIPYDALENISGRMIREIKNISRVLYDIT